MPSQHGQSDGQIGNLSYGDVDAVITSPPYNAEPTTLESYKRIRTAIGRHTTKPSQNYEKYSAKVDAVITSPPYEGSGSDQSSSEVYTNWCKQHGRNPESPSALAKSENSYAPSDSNIGNLKSENYLEAMLQVYRQCQQVLRDNGLMVLVVKNFIRDKKIVRLDLDTIKLCEEAGFKLIEQLKRKLTQQSFWRTIYYQKFSNVTRIEHEDVLIFEEKPKGRPPGEVTNVNDWSGGA